MAVVPDFFSFANTSSLAIDTIDFRAVTEIIRWRIELNGLNFTHIF